MIEKVKATRIFVVALATAAFLATAIDLHLIGEGLSDMPALLPFAQINPGKAPSATIAVATPLANLPDIKSPAPQQAPPIEEISSRLCGPARQLRMDFEVSIDIVDCQRPIGLTYENLRISVTQRQVSGNQVPESIVTFRSPGQRPQRIVVSAAEIGGLTFGVGRLDRSGAYYIMVHSFTAGNHCCFGVNIVVPEGPDRGAVELGYFDANASNGLEDIPDDIDGDGRTDFVRRDDRFYYQFASYVGTDQPLRIWNIRRGTAIDVSAERRFRSAYRRDLAGRRAACLQTQRYAVNLECPAYVATAARVGRFVSAWRDMLRVYSLALRNQTVDEDFPQDLRRFLRHHGYLRG